MAADGCIITLTDILGGINTYSKEYERAKKEFYNCLRMSIFGLGVPIYIALHEWWPIMQREKQKALDAGKH